MRSELMKLSPMRFFCRGEWHNWRKNKEDIPLSHNTVMDPVRLSFKDKNGKLHQVQLFFDEDRLWLSVDGVVSVTKVSDIKDETELGTAMFEYADHGQMFGFGFGFYLPDYQKVMGSSGQHPDAKGKGRSSLYDIYD